MSKPIPDPSRRRGESPDAELGFVRRYRRALVALPLVMAAALGVTVWSGYRSVRAALDTVARGQGDTIMHLIRRTSPPRDKWDDAGLAELLEDHTAAGLRCVIVIGARFDVEASAGDCSRAITTKRELRRTTPDVLLESGGRLRLLSMLPPPRRPGGPGRRRPRPEGERSDEAGHDPNHDPERGDRPPRDRRERDDRRDGARGPNGRRRPGPPPRGRRERQQVLIEFEPTLTASLERGARRTLFTGSAASLALVLTACVFYWLALRAERMRLAHERERRLAALGEMSAVLAHELRNPLASVKGHAQLLAERLADDTRDRLSADRVVRDILRLEELTDDLLDFVRSPQLDRTDVDPRALLREALEAIDPDDRARIRIIVAPDTPRTWSLDSGRLQQVLQNLLRNAMMASPAEGNAAVASIGVKGRALTIAVRDFGDGVPTEDREQIFEPFHTTRVRGTGLGLAIADRIVKLHGGRIEVDDHPDGGAVFRVTLPRG